jgi:hypothetical protein
MASGHLNLLLAGSCKPFERVNFLQMKAPILVSPAKPFPIFYPFFVSLDFG